MCDRTRLNGLGGARSGLSHRSPEAERARGSTLRAINTLRRRFGLGEIPAHQAERIHSVDLGRELVRLEARAWGEDGEPDRADARCGGARCDQLRIDWGR